MTQLIPRRNVILGAAAGTAVATFPLASAWANTTFPDRPIKLIVPWSAGGSTDALSRAVGQRLGEVLGQTLVIENRPGAAGRLGVDAMTKATADGYTIAVIELTHAIAPAIYQKMSYDIMSDAAAISMLGHSPLILFVNAEKYKRGQYPKFLEDAKKGKSPFAIATSGHGSISHLAAGLLAKETGVEFQMIPYKGSAPALIDVAAGLADGHICTLASASSLLASGKVVPLMVTGSKRVAQLADVPCAAELRLTRMDFGQWWALMAPAQTPKPVLDTLYKATASSLQDKQVKDRTSSLSINLGSKSPDETLPFIRAEATKWAKVVNELGIRQE